MSACRINHLVFWADGAVVTPAGQAVWDFLAPGRRADAKERLELHRLEQGLADGALSPEQFCTSLVALSRSSQTVPHLMETLPGQIVPIAGMPEVLEELACRRLALSLVSGYPRQWLSPAMERCGLAREFPEGQTWLRPKPMYMG
jgi:beta-phosphoglucomutase-like phosphatase (HAD superfamily)